MEASGGAVFAGKTESALCAAPPAQVVAEGHDEAGAVGDTSALPVAALFGLDAFTQLDAFMENEDFDGAARAARGGARARCPGAWQRF